MDNDIDMEGVRGRNMPKCPWTIEELVRLLDEFLQKGPVHETFHKVEQNLRIKRQNFVLGCLAVIAAYLVVGSQAHFLCNFIAFLYPAWVCVESIEKHDFKNDNMKWITYWIVYNGFDLVEYIYLSYHPEMPLHWFLKCTFLVLCFLPPWSISERLCWYIIGPFIRLCQTFIYENMTRNAFNEKGLWKAFIVCFGFFIYLHNSKSVSELLCCYIGFFYPVYALVKDVDVSDPYESHHWHAYWVTYSAWGLIEFSPITWIPLYWPGKLIFLLAHFLPGPSNTSFLYTRLCDKIQEHELVKKVSKVWSKFFLKSHASVKDSSQLEEENRLLKEQQLCKICLDERVCMTFVPCGHLLCCSSCASVMTECPVCRGHIKESVRTYMS